MAVLYIKEECKSLQFFMDTNATWWEEDAFFKVENIIYKFNAADKTTVIEKVLTDKELDLLEHHNRFINATESLESLVETCPVTCVLNTYDGVSGYFGIFSPKLQMFINKGVMSFNAGSNVENATDHAASCMCEFMKIQLETGYNDYDFYAVDIPTRTSTLLKKVEIDPDYSAKKHYTLSAEAWAYIIHYLTHGSADPTDVRTFRDESIILNDLSTRADRIYSSQHIGSYALGVPKERIVVHTLQEIKRLLHIKTDDKPLTAKNGGIVTDKLNVGTDSNKKAYSSNILNSIFNNIVLLQNPDLVEIDPFGCSFITSVETIRNKIGDEDLLAEHNDNQEISIIEMINKRFAEIGNLKKLETNSLNNCVNAINEINRYKIQTGAIMWYAGLEAPAGWKFCDGSIMSAADYPELYNAIGDRYNLASDNFVQGEEFRLPTGNARIVCGHDADNPNFDTIGKRDGLAEVNVDSSTFNLINHGYQNQSIRDGAIGGTLEEEAVNVLQQEFMEPLYDEEIETSTDNLLKIKIDDHKSFDGEYDRWPSYSINNVMTYISEDTDFSTITRVSKQMTNAGYTGEALNPYHSNLQPYITLRMIIKVDKQDWE